jgi:hypothetical protein
MQATLKSTLDLSEDILQTLQPNEGVVVATALSLALGRICAQAGIELEDAIVVAKASWRASINAN